MKRKVSFMAFMLSIALLFGCTKDDASDVVEESDSSENQEETTAETYDVVYYVNLSDDLMSFVTVVANYKDSEGKDQSVALEASDMPFSKTVSGLEEDGLIYFDVELTMEDVTESDLTEDYYTISMNSYCGIYDSETGNLKTNLSLVSGSVDAPASKVLEYVEAYAEREFVIAEKTLSEAF